MHCMIEMVVVRMFSVVVEHNKETLLNISYGIIQQNNTKHRNEDTKC